MPLFGDRRSPSCVEDWLEINDFDVPEPVQYSPIKAKVPEPKKTLTIQTRFLQRENSFRSSGGSSGRTVKSIIESFSKSNPIKNKSPETRSRFTNSTTHVPQSSKLPNPIQKEPPKLSRSAFVPLSDKNTLKQVNYRRVYENESLLLTPRVMSIIPKTTQSSSTSVLAVTSPSVLSSLKPARRKKRQAPRAEDIYTNSKEKQQIMQTLSHMDIRSSDDNYDIVIDSFSLEGEFV